MPESQPPSARIWDIKPPQESQKTSLKTGKIVRELVLEENLIKADELDEILDAYAMTEPEVILIKEAM